MHTSTYIHAPIHTCIHAHTYMHTHNTYSQMHTSTCIHSCIEANTYSPMVRLNIDFVGSINTDEDSGYILVIIDTFSKWVELSTHAKMPQPKLLQSVSYSTSVATEHHLRYCSTIASNFVNELITE